MLFMNTEQEPFRWTGQAAVLTPITRRWWHPTENVWCLAASVSLQAAPDNTAQPKGA